MSVDWDKVRVEYIRSDISLRDLGEKHGIPEATIMRRSGKEKWFDQRKEYDSKVQAKLNQKLETTADKEAERLLNLRESVVDTFVEVRAEAREAGDYTNTIKANIELGKIVEAYPAAKQEVKQDGTLTIQVDYGANDKTNAPAIARSTDTN